MTLSLPPSQYSLITSIIISCNTIKEGVSWWSKVRQAYLALVSAVWLNFCWSVKKTGSRKLNNVGTAACTSYPCGGSRHNGGSGYNGSGSFCSCARRDKKASLWDIKYLLGSLDAMSTVREVLSDTTRSSFYVGFRLIYFFGVYLCIYFILCLVSSTYISLFYIMTSQVLLLYVFGRREKK